MKIQLEKNEKTFQEIEVKLPYFTSQCSGKYQYKVISETECIEVAIGSDYIRPRIVLQPVSTAFSDGYEISTAREYHEAFEKVQLILKQ